MKRPITKHEVLICLKQATAPGDTSVTALLLSGHMGVSTNAVAQALRPLVREGRAGVVKDGGRSFYYWISDKIQEDRLQPLFKGFDFMDSRAWVSDEQIVKAFTGTNFGPNSLSYHRTLLEKACVKKSQAYHCGGTITRIMLEMGLIHRNETLTALGKQVSRCALHKYLTDAP
ncbi:hypothetical protein RG2014_067 [Delftia phage RG-2014]|uniref:Uncharacterized protein n=1 Tax=Delftia phage RG-2014 TaxID=1563661 RepID=A0A097PBE0_9CAUD|nr:hypothetical protein RG2014_067 [Delftia phage RG-2014]AIU44321.1 hypothetical protein RG2014_067 [Delftia phage RG-2014]